MRNNAIITPQILIWARERLDLSLQDASAYLKIKPEKLQSWEDGSKYPTINQAKEVAKKYKIPYVFFYLPEPPQNIKLPKNQDYRTFTNQPIRTFSIELKSLLFDIMQRREAMLQLNQELAIEPPQFNYFFDIQTTDENVIAEKIRTMINLPDHFKAIPSYEALKFFRNTLENIGILVFQAKDIDINEMRGLSVFEEIYPIIVVNRDDEVRARIFTLMHELVHLITRTAGICNKFEMFETTAFDLELKCNYIAAKVLVPENLLDTRAIYIQLLKDWNDELVRQLGNTFAVSREVILGRLLTLKKISFAFYRQKMMQYTKEYLRNKENNKENETDRRGPPPSVDKGSQLGKTYISTVLAAYNQEIITARDAIQYFDGLKLKHFDKLERWCFT